MPNYQQLGQIYVVKNEPQKAKSDRLLGALITRSQRGDQEAVDSIKNFYLEHISFHAVAADIAEQKRVESEETSLESASGFEVDRFREQEMRRVCDTVCGIMKDMFEFILTRASN